MLTFSFDPARLRSRWPLLAGSCPSSPTATGRFCWKSRLLAERLFSSSKNAQFWCRYVKTKTDRLLSEPDFNVDHGLSW